MRLLSGLFKSRDKPKNRINGNSYSFLWVHLYQGEE